MYIPDKSNCPRWERQIQSLFPLHSDSPFPPVVLALVAGCSLWGSTAAPDCPRGDSRAHRVRPSSASVATPSHARRRAHRVCRPGWDREEEERRAGRRARVKSRPRSQRWQQRRQARQDKRCQLHHLWATHHHLCSIRECVVSLCRAHLESCWQRMHLSSWRSGSAESSSALRTTTACDSMSHQTLLRCYVTVVRVECTSVCLLMLDSRCKSSVSRPTVRVRTGAAQPVSRSETVGSSD